MSLSQLAEQFSKLQKNQGVVRGEIGRQEKTGDFQDIIKLAKKTSLSSLVKKFTPENANQEDLIGAATRLTNVTDAVKGGVDVNMMKQVLITVAEATNSGEVARDVIDLLTSESLVPFMRLLSEGSMRGKIDVDMINQHMLNAANQSLADEIQIDYSATGQNLWSLDYAKLYKILSSTDFRNMKGGLVIIMKTIIRAVRQRVFTSQMMVKLIKDLVRNDELSRQENQQVSNNVGGMTNIELEGAMSTRGMM